MWGPHILLNITNQQLRDYEVPWSPSFVLGLPPRGNFWIIVQVTMKHDPSDVIGIHVDFYTHLALT